MEQVEVIIARHDERISDLEKWQKKQNGTLQKLYEKVDRLYVQQMTILGGLVVSIVLLCANILLGR
jgi:hypothetical protein